MVFIRNFVIWPFNMPNPSVLAPPSSPLSNNICIPKHIPKIGFFLSKKFLYTDLNCVY